jgi:hypothetical protein
LSYSYKGLYTVDFKWVTRELPVEVIYDWPNFTDYLLTPEQILYSIKEPDDENTKSDVKSNTKSDDLFFFLL